MTGRTGDGADEQEERIEGPGVGSRRQRGTHGRDQRPNPIRERPSLLVQLFFSKFLAEEQQDG